MSKQLSGDRIIPGTHVHLRLPSGVFKIVKVLPDTTISLGKFGTFPSNSLLHRPYNLVYDILDNNTGLRIVPASEVASDILGGGVKTEPVGSGGGTTAGNADETHYDLNYASNTPGTPAGNDTTEEGTEEPVLVEVAAQIAEVMRTNRLTFDDPLSQTLTWEEIEELKKKSGNSGKDLIQKLLDGHNAIDQKTPFSLQKYTLRKASKFLRRFSVQKLTVSSLCDYLQTTKEPHRYLEIKNHHLGLMLSLGNIVYGGRYLVVDESGGLLVSAVAERLGILTASNTESTTNSDGEEPEHEHRKRKKDSKLPRGCNTITLAHANEQPNLSLLAHFGYDANTPPPSHPLYKHFKTITWLQLLHPSCDKTLIPPPTLSAEELAALKAGKRSTYYRKLRRWQKISSTVAETREGGFDAVLIVGNLSVPGILKAVVPLVRGSGQVVVYTPTLEQATEISDLYSSSRRAEWIAKKYSTEPGNGLVNDTVMKIKTEEEIVEEAGEDQNQGSSNDEEQKFTEWEDETPDPTLLLAATIHRLNTRQYQVLPGRTHPVMTSKGGAEGYIFHGTRVVPVAGRVDARGAYASQKKKRRITADAESTGPEEVLC
jgi:tRNA (adenine-N(1)-)-methyltransferase non-catalytic subunit